MIQRDRDYLESALQDLLDSIAQEFCLPCQQENKNLKPVNLHDPLACGCVCEKVRDALEHARCISLNLQKVMD